MLKEYGSFKDTRKILKKIIKTVAITFLGITGSCIACIFGQAVNSRNPYENTPIVKEYKAMSETLDSLKHEKKTILFTIAIST